MDLSILLGLVVVVAAIALILVYFIRSALNFDDASVVDELPRQNDSSKTENL